MRDDIGPDKRHAAIECQFPTTQQCRMSWVPLRGGTIHETRLDRLRPTITEYDETAICHSARSHDAPMPFEGYKNPPDRQEKCPDLGSPVTGAARQPGIMQAGA